ncbi:hypothetical protein TVAG_193620 [Trichomonas vaginalis G3]|uniref:Uncharacterized protein n=1 Tax=Trichomonas vaginalis (strain ATCC PRA-98 / G3) TaxID=412133 RepID=A2EVL3_TRIV3|nr:hypothetical protein TVAGG3_0357930 [Trichomonas vaginalis G3]EAY03292.1 hypothetical protein TVAG_193620 [Trichomonas vaginalis G3]KAI5531746.1 hypothetical protein TVAGG3_0357930 [Trichomonas vaginalis G3]|eukprot:XP_001315515.1 hypothetical protein [Trichomonas vaginalis G3]
MFSILLGSAISADCQIIEDDTTITYIRLSNSPINQPICYQSKNSRLFAYFGIVEGYEITFQELDQNDQPTESYNFNEKTAAFLFKNKGRVTVTPTQEKSTLQMDLMMTNSICQDKIYLSRKSLQRFQVKDGSIFKAKENKEVCIFPGVNQNVTMISNMNYSYAYGSKITEVTSETASVQDVPATYIRYISNDIGDQLTIYSSKVPEVSYFSDFISYGLNGYVPPPTPTPKPTPQPTEDVRPEPIDPDTPHPTKNNNSKMITRRIVIVGVCAMIALIVISVIIFVCITNAHRRLRKVEESTMTAKLLA